MSCDHIPKQPLEKAKPRERMMRSRGLNPKVFSLAANASEGEPPTLPQQQEESGFAALGDVAEIIVRRLREKQALPPAVARATALLLYREVVR